MEAMSMSMIRKMNHTSDVNSAGIPMPPEKKGNESDRSSTMIRCPVCKHKIISRTQYKQGQKIKCSRCGYEYNPIMTHIRWVDEVHY